MLKGLETKHFKVQVKIITKTRTGMGKPGKLHSNTIRKNTKVPFIEMKDKRQVIGLQEGLQRYKGVLR